MKALPRKRSAIRALSISSLLLMLLAAALDHSGDVAAASRRPAGNAGVCERYMLTAARRHRVPLAVLYAVGLTETGRKGSLRPWALNIHGKAVYAGSPEEALRIFRSARARGKYLIDLGCMQINHHYHGRQFASPRQMLDPAANVDYAARFLRRLYEREGSWTMAAARYHAGPNNDAAQKRYVCAVIRNLVATGFGRWTPAARRFCRR